MWRVLLAAVLTGLISIVALNAPRAQFNGCQAGFCSPAASAGGFTPSCSQSTAFLAAATGVTLTADKTNYDTMICGLVTDGEWNFDVLYIWAAPSVTNVANINLAQPGTFNGTPNGTPTAFTAYQGYTGDGSTFYINSGLNPIAATSTNCSGSPCYTQNNATLGVYVRNARTTGNLIWNIGTATGTNPLFAAYQTGAGHENGQINSASTVGGTSANSQGAYNLTRVASSSEHIYVNSNEIADGSVSDTSAAPDNANIIFFALNPSLFWAPDQMAAGWISKGLTGADSCKINNRINTYLAAYGNNIYSNVAC